MVMSSCEESCELLAIVRFGELLICPVGPMVIGPSICMYPLLNVNEPLLESVRLFDVFSGKDEQHLGPERKSLAYTLTYRDKSRTLTSDEVNAAHGRIRERLRTKLGAELRE